MSQPTASLTKLDGCEPSGGSSVVDRAVNQCPVHSHNRGLRLTRDLTPQRLDETHLR